MQAEMNKHLLYDHMHFCFSNLGIHNYHSDNCSAPVGSLQITMYEKSCAVPSQCGRSGQKYASGFYFNYTNICCDTDLCNGAASFAALSWGRAALSLLPALTLLLA